MPLNITYFLFGLLLGVLLVYWLMPNGMLCSFPSVYLLAE